MPETRYQFPLQAYTEAQIQQEAAAVVPGCFGVCGGVGTVVFLYLSALTAAQQKALADVVSAHVPAAPTTAQKLDARPMAARVVAALTIKASTQWASLATAQQAKVQAVIDAEAATLLVLL